MIGLGVLSSYPDALKVFLGVFLAANLITGLLYAAAKRWGALPAIRQRDVHTTRKPRLGGVGMWLAVVGVLMVLAAQPGPGLLDFGQGYTGFSRVLWGVVGGLVVLLIFGLLDDIKGLPAAWQLVGQVVAGASLVIGDVAVPYVRVPFVGQVTFTPFWSAIFVVFWVVVIINALNLFDGLDGLAGSVSLTGSFILLLVSLSTGLVGASTLALLTFGASAGFLPWNWHPSRLFMGSVGSQLLGFLLATIAIISGAKVAAALLVLGLPLFDAVSVVVRRARARQPLFQADQRHLHHRLLHIGLSTPQVVLVANIVTVTFGVLALKTQETNEKGILTLLLVAALFGVIAVTYFLERRVRQA